jgi:hypothetical protein
MRANETTVNIAADTAGYNRVYFRQQMLAHPASAPKALYQIGNAKIFRKRDTDKFACWLRAKGK